jgi:hypothetical protein
MPVYLTGIVIGDHDSVEVINFKRLAIRFKSRPEMEKYRLSWELNLNDNKQYDPTDPLYKRLYFNDTHSKKASSIVDRKKASPEEINNKATNGKRITELAEKYIKARSKTALAELLGIQRPTLNVRLEKHNWKKSEMFIIQRL